MVRFVIAIICLLSSAQIFAQTPSNSEIVLMTINEMNKNAHVTAKQKQAVWDLVQRCSQVNANGHEALEDLTQDPENSISRLGALYMGVELLANEVGSAPLALGFYQKCSKVVRQAYQINGARLTGKRKEM